MHIGLIGGIGPAATDFYYRRLISSFVKEKQPLELTIAHADTPTLLGNLMANNVEAQVAIYQHLTKRLVLAGAECVVVTSIAGHFCIEPFKAVSPLPVIDMIQEVGKAVESRGLKRIGILGTATVMKSQFYGGIKTADVLAPAGADLEAVHQAYIAMAALGTVNETQREIFDKASQRLMKEQDAEAIMLGGTDLALVYNESNAPFPLVDCAGIHVDAIVREAMG